MKITDLHNALPAIGDNMDARLAEGLLVTSPNLVYLYDLLESRYIYLTGETSSVLGYTSGEILAMGNSVQAKLVHKDDAQRLAGHHRECAAAREGDLLEIEYRVRHAYGDWHWLSARDTPLVNPGVDGVRFILGVAEDISERRAAQEKVYFLSTHDQLTGLFNRAYFEAEIGRMEKSRRFPISILCVDVDKLHEANDAEGHEAGDELLRRTGQVLMSAFRAEDVVARLGGDEFAVILPNTGTVSTEAILARVKIHLSTHNQSHRDKLLSLSLGIATVDFGQSLNEAVKNAEKKLYEAKLASAG